MNLENFVKKDLLEQNLNNYTNLIAVIYFFLWYNWINIFINYNSGQRLLEPSD